MKKLLFLLFLVNFILVSFLSVKQFEYLEFQTFMYSLNNGKNNWNLEIIERSSTNNKNNFEVLTEIASKTNLNLQRISYENFDGKSEKVVYYVALYKGSNYFEKMKLKHGEYLSENSHSKQFLSTIETGNKNQIGQLEIFRSFDPIEIRPMIAAKKTKDIKGLYTISGKGNIVKFKEFAKKYGFSIKISNEHPKSIFTEYPYQKMIYVTSFVLCLLISLTMFYDLIENYKIISIMLMHGTSFLQIGIYLGKRYLKCLTGAFLFVGVGLVSFLHFYNQYQQFNLFILSWLKNISILVFMIIFSIIILWISTCTININQMIKNKKPIKMLFYLNIIVRFILVIIVILGLEQGISTFHQLKETTEQQKKWKILKNYSILGIEADFETVNHLNVAKLSNFKKVYYDLENEGAVYIAPSYYYLKDVNFDINPNPWSSEGKQVVINKNYLTLNPIYDVYNKKIKLPRPSDKVINVLVPQKYNENIEEIKNNVRVDYSKTLNREHPELVKINIILVRNKQKYFSFSTKMADKTNYEIMDPVAVIITPKFDPLITSSTIAMGYGYFTKNSIAENSFNKTQEVLNKYGFKNVWKPVEIAYSNVEQKIISDTELLHLTLIKCAVFLLLTAVLLIFTGINYLEKYKQLFAIQRIFGFNYFEKHYLVYFALLVFWQLSYTACILMSNQRLLLFKITISLFLCDILIVSVLFLKKEFKVSKLVLIEK